MPVAQLQDDQTLEVTSPLPFSVAGRSVPRWGKVTVGELLESGEWPPNSILTMVLSDKLRLVGYPNESEARIEAQRLCRAVDAGLPAPPPEPADDEVDVELAEGTDDQNASAPEIPTPDVKPNGDHLHIGPVGDDGAPVAPDVHLGMDGDDVVLSADDDPPPAEPTPNRRGGGRKPRAAATR